MSSIDTKSILIAEDNQVMADVVRFNLERAGYDITMACSGEEAWEILEEESFDLLVTDFQMPYMNGDELCKRIKESGQHVDMKVIMCSAKGFELKVDRLQEECNIMRLIYKPFSPNELKEIVAEVFELSEVSHS